MSDKVQTPIKETETRTPPSHRDRLLKQRSRSRHDSELSRQSFSSGSPYGRKRNESVGSGSIHRRLSYRRQSSLGLPHIDSFKSFIVEEEAAVSKEGGT